MGQTYLIINEESKKYIATSEVLPNRGDHININNLEYEITCIFRDNKNLGTLIFVKRTDNKYIKMLSEIKFK